MSYINLSPAMSRIKDKSEQDSCFPLESILSIFRPAEAAYNAIFYSNIPAFTQTLYVLLGLLSPNVSLTRFVRHTLYALLSTIGYTAAVASSLKMDAKACLPTNRRFISTTAVPSKVKTGKCLAKGFYIHPLCGACQCANSMYRIRKEGHSSNA